jgi:probable HAF family extracellular repeat protein
MARRYGPITLVAAALLAPLALHAAPIYTVTPLGTLGGSSGDVRAINNKGQVVGYSLNRRNEGNAYVSTRGAMQTLHPANAGTSAAAGINDAGVIAGTLETGGVTQAVRFTNRQPQPVQALGGAGSEAVAINNAGQVAGTGTLPGSTVRHAFVSTPWGGVRDLGTLGGANSVAADINDSGSVTGHADIDGGYHAFRWTNGIMQDLGTLGGTFSEGTGINAAGRVTGFSYLGGNGNAHAFVTDGDRMVDLQTLGGANSFGYGINDRGDVVGSSEVAGNNALHAFLYSGGVMLDLNALVGPGFGWVLHYAADINEWGQIAAFGCNAVSQCQGFLLTPDGVPGEVPEPAGPGLVLLGLSLLALRARSKPPALPKQGA